MPNPTDTSKKSNKGQGFTGFALKRIAVAAILIVAVIWVLTTIPDMLRPSGAPPKVKKTEAGHLPQETALDSNGAPTTGKGHGLQTNTAAGVPKDRHAHDRTAAQPDGTHDTDHGGHQQAAMGSRQHSAAGAAGQPVGMDKPVSTATGHKQDGASAPATRMQDHPSEHASQPDLNAEKAASGKHPNDDATRHGEDKAAHAPADGTPHSDPAASQHVDVPTGVRFVEAVIQPLRYELEERWWGWRLNDIVNLTDNVNNMQLGILEVTRRSAIQLSERISRTGTTDSLNRHLENAVNWLMVKPDRYWFPSPESKYKESMSELEAYIEQLMKHQASFYTRPDNVIPLLSAYEELLGSCDENLVKQKNEDGSTVSWFQADDYFFYAKGVARAMAIILEAVHHDFAPTLEGRHGSELLHHAIESCKQAAELNPILITNGSLDGIFANHRANIAAPISHARFYIGQLIKTLST